MEQNKEKKLIVEEKGTSKEVTKDELEKLQKNPDYLLKLHEDTPDEQRFRVLQRLHD
jgi:hypothetical protein